MDNFALFYSSATIFFSFTDKRKGMLKNTSTNQCLMSDGSNSSANLSLFFDNDYKKLKPGF